MKKIEMTMLEKIELFQLLYRSKNYKNVHCKHSV